VKNTTYKIVVSSLFAALVCVATMIIKIPLPNGYINIGDCVVLASALTLSPAYAFAAAGIGSAMADLFSGYALYAPATFIIKGLMALVTFYIFKLLSKRINPVASKVIGGAAAEIIMIGGYFLFEGALYGFVPSLSNIPANAIQGAAGLVLGILLSELLHKSKIGFNGK